MIENNLAQRQPFEANEAREPTAEERLEAEQRAIAELLAQNLKDPLICDAIGTNPWAEREIQAHVQVGCATLTDPDFCSLGRIVYYALRDYVRRLPDYDGEVDRQLLRLRQDRADMAKADDEFESTL